MWWTTLMLALREIRRNLLRSFLTMLGIVIGVAAVITMVTLGNGATRARRRPDLQPGQQPADDPARPAAGPGARRRRRARLQGGRRAGASRTQIGGIRAVAPSPSSRVHGGLRRAQLGHPITGTTNAYFETNNWQVADGRTFTDSEERAGAAVCLIGATVRRELFGAQDPLGARSRVKQFSCQVIGLLASKGQAAMGQDQDDTVILPLHAVQRRLTGNQNVGTLLVSMKDGADAEQLKNGITQLLRERRKLERARRRQLQRAGHAPDRRHAVGHDPGA